jgi:SSS family transporter
MNAVLLGVMGYVLAQLALGIAVSRRIKTEDDYLLAGRRFGYGLATFSIFATWFGAETCIGSAGAVYADGLSAGRADPFGYALCLLLMALVFAVPLYKRKLVTLADLFRQRFSPRVERIAVLLMVPTSLLWAAAQIRAFGQVLSHASSFELGVSVTIAAGVVVIYTAAGGLLADAVTDVFQGVAIIVGLVIVTALVVTNAGGVAASLEQVPPERMTLFAGPSLLETVDGWLVPICGSVVAQELISRILASRSVQVARRSALFATAIYVTIGVLPLFIGLVGPGLMPGLAEPEQLLPALAGKLLPTGLYVLFVGALVSAILSTVDSTLLASASLVSHNVVVPLRPELDEQGKTRVARAFVVIFGIVAYVIALHAEGVYSLVEDASSFGSAGLFVSMAFGLFTRIGGAASAGVALLLGTVVWLIGTYVAPFPAPYLAALVAAALGYLCFVRVGAAAPAPTLSVTPP